MARLLRMPTVAANAVEAVLSEWPVPENTRFTVDDVIATVETEKAVVDLPADADGVILRTLVQAGAEVLVGAPIALLGDAGEVVADVDAVLAELGLAPDGSALASGGAQDNSVVSGTSATVSGPAVRTPAQAPAKSADWTGGRVFASPLARRRAKDAGLTLPELMGTGPGGRIVRRDVERAIEGRRTSSDERAVERKPGDTSTPNVRTPAPTRPGAVTAYEDIPHTRTRRAIAARLGVLAFDDAGVGPGSSPG